MIYYFVIGEIKNIRYICSVSKIVATLTVIKCVSCARGTSFCTQLALFCSRIFVITSWAVLNADTPTQIHVKSIDQEATCAIFGSLGAVGTVGVANEAQMRSRVTILSTWTSVNTGIGAKLEEVVGAVEGLASGAAELIPTKALRAVVVTGVAAVVAVVAIVAVGTFQEASVV